MNKIKFYYVDEDYLNYLHGIDYKSPIKSNRYFIGVVLNINKYDYYAPLSSPKPKHKHIDNTATFVKIRNGELGGINLNNMIPVPKKYIHLADIRHLDDEKYRILSQDQVRWCNRNKTTIFNNAKYLYKIITENNWCVKNICCDFKKLEYASDRYIKAVDIFRYK